ncbi:MAG: hypothetical protein ACE5E1_09235 [Phycisphaerae bacterium]
MTVEEAQRLVRSLRRQFLLASVARGGLLALIGVGMLGSFWQVQPGGALDLLWPAAMLAAVAWGALTVFSVRQVQAANQASAYIASGRLDLAEEQLKTAMRQFSLYENGKLLACHNLAVVAHGRKSFQAAAELCDGVIAIRKGRRLGIGHTCRILLADARLSLGDTVSALRAIEPLSLRDADLSLAEQLLLLPIDLRCRIATEQFEEAAAALPWKVRRAELLDAPRAALAHELLAMACRRTGRAEAAGFLHRRAVLYHDLDELAADYPVLRDSAPSATSADNL